MEVFARSQRQAYTPIQNPFNTGFLPWVEHEVVDMTPASEFLAALTKIKNRIVQVSKAYVISWFP
jgi:hypothetical protein